VKKMVAMKLALTITMAMVPEAVHSLRTSSGARRRSTLQMKGLSRRSVLVAPAAAAIAVAGWPARRAVAAGGSAPKVVVVGGAGWVGSYVDQELARQGATVVSVSRSSAETQAARVFSNTGSVPQGLTFVSADASCDDLVKIFKGSDAVINCCGIAPGGENMFEGNGKVNVNVADAAKAAGVPKYVYIGVASNMGVTNGPARIALGDYFKGKAIAEAAVTADYESTSSLIIKPAAVRGAPAGESRPPSPPGAASVYPAALAKAAVSGALGFQSGVLDGAQAINNAATSFDIRSAAPVINPTDALIKPRVGDNRISGDVKVIGYQR